MRRIVVGLAVALILPGCGGRATPTLGERCAAGDSKACDEVTANFKEACAAGDTDACDAVTAMYEDPEAEFEWYCRERLGGTVTCLSSGDEVCSVDGTPVDMLEGSP